MMPSWLEDTLITRNAGRALVSARRAPTRSGLAELSERNQKERVRSDARSDTMALPEHEIRYTVGGTTEAKGKAASLGRDSAGPL